ncbi:MAG: methionyl-tRNA formyltransferase [Colwellia sp.]|nr:methionyl-tRNA formyltransferase [Colwellia sp.]
MSTYLIVSQHQRHQTLFNRLQQTLKGQWEYISTPEQLTVEKLSVINPKYIFIPHWSHKVPVEITDKFVCIMFHMTDLPFGRGGSPLQNLIVRGIKETQLSAFRCIEKLDAGPIYGKLPLLLSGSAREIFDRADTLVSQLIFDIIQKNIQPSEQTGNITAFKRRTPEQSNLSSLVNLSDIYDYIRMLDADGYPNAFLNSGKFILTFTDAAYDAEQVTAQVVFKRMPTESEIGKCS